MKYARLLCIKNIQCFFKVLISSLKCPTSTSGKFAQRLRVDGTLLNFVENSVAIIVSLLLCLLLYGSMLKKLLSILKC